MINTVTLVGAGNLATQLGKALVKNGVEVTQVYSRTMAAADALSCLLGCSATDKCSSINLDSDLIIVALKDDSIRKVLDRISFSDQLVVHTAGSLPMDLLKNYSSRYGVLYPLQTFSKAKSIDFETIPFCIEAVEEELTNELLGLAGRLSKYVYRVNSSQRKSLHLSAVFCCNFVNHFYTIADQLLEEADLPFELLKPLIKETSEKIRTVKPFEAQTGPAVRFDEKVIGGHIAQLTDHREWAELYQLISEDIFHMHKKINE